MRSLLLLTLLCALTGCENDSSNLGSSDCYGSFVDGVHFLGNWDTDTVTGTLSLGPDCYGRETSCDTKFVFTKPVGRTLTLTVSETSGAAGCLAVGTHSCTAESSLDPGSEPRTQRLTITCGATSTDFSRY